MRKVIVIAGLALALTACGSINEDGVANTKKDAPNTYTFYVEAINGKTVACVWGQSGYAGGLSCDWSAR